jgi:2-oxoisovalerate dehydrogenase E1 component
MSYDRAAEVDRKFTAFLEGGFSDARPLPPGSPSGETLLELLESQMLCRHLDFQARKLRAEDQAFYTIASTGHEGNVVVGDLCRHTDPAFLHYRSGAAMIQRSRKVPEIDIVRDVLLGLVVSSEDPASGGRHKVWGSLPLWVPPQTSTIGSHLPKAVGAALAIERARRLGLPLLVPADSIVTCSFGDASLNHSTAQGAFNAAAWLAHQNLPLPVLFVCEDNGLGISVKTPPEWVEVSMRQRPGFTYLSADGLDLLDAHRVTRQAVDLCRSLRRPVFLHLKVTRLMGHAGSDVEREYHSLEEIEANERRDPLIASAALVIRSGVMEAADVLALYEAARVRVADAARQVVERPKLTSAAEVMEPLAPTDQKALAMELARPVGEGPKMRPVVGRQRTLATLINRGLHEAMVKYPEALVFGEDVAKKGGVYHVTAGLWKAFGSGRVFNTLLDEQSILGLAIGAAHLGFLAIPEIQYLAYLHNAEDQIRGEACSLQFFSRDQFRNPMVVRIASFAYQKGFGGHFHNDHSVAVLRDVPGLILAAPARGDDAVKMLRTCMALARTSGRVIAFLEPIALYMAKDLHEEGDGLWLSDFPAHGEAIAVGEARAYNEEAKGLTIVSYANGLYLSLKAAKALEAEGIEARVVDLRWLNPIDHAFVAEHARATGRALVVDECRRAGGLGEAVVAALAERCPEVTVALHAADDTYLPLGPAMATCLPDESTIAEAARKPAVRLERPGRRRRRAGVEGVTGRRRLGVWGGDHVAEPEPRGGPCTPIPTDPGGRHSAGPAPEGALPFVAPRRPVRPRGGSRGGSPTPG